MLTIIFLPEINLLKSLPHTGFAVIYVPQNTALNTVNIAPILEEQLQNTNSISAT